MIAESLQDVLEYVEQYPLLAVDTETHGLTMDLRKKIVGMSIWGLNANEGIYVPFGHDYRETAFEGVFSEDDNLSLDILPEIGNSLYEKKLVFFNGKYDLSVLELNKIGWDLRQLDWYDSQLLIYLTDENLLSYKLKPLGKFILKQEDAADQQKIIKKLTKNETEWFGVPIPSMDLYATKDTQLTLDLYLHVLPQVVKDGLLEYWEQQMRPYVIDLLEIERRGILYDHVECKTHAIETRKELESLLPNLTFNPLSPHQLRDRLYKKHGFEPYAYTKHGAPSTEESVLQHFQEQTDSAKIKKELETVIRCRKLSHSLNTYLEGWLKRTQEDGRIHPTFKIFGTTTGRLSCEEPNMQNIPRDYEMSPAKQLIRAPKGYAVVEFDYSQVEFRLATVYSKNDPWLKAYQTGADAHQATADSVGISRQDAKTLNFLLLYLGGVERIMEAFGISRERATVIRDTFKRTNPKFYATSYQVSNLHKQQGYIKLWTGRFRRLGHNHHKAWNSLIQGGAHEIMRVTTRKLSEANVTVISEVHDSVWTEIPLENLESDIERIKAIMEWPTKAFKLPFPVDFKVMHEHV